jgi:hypothetical protein
LRIATGICVYSDAKGLDRLLPSIVDNIDKCIVVHGCYTNYNGIDPFSYEATKAVCRRYSNAKVLLINNPKPTDQIVARQMYMDAAGADCDFLLVLDADEYVTGDWTLFRENCQKIIDSTTNPFYIYDIKFDRPFPQWYDGWPRPRLFRKPSQIQYYRKHYWWKLPTGKIHKTSASDSQQIIEGIKITMDNTYRSNERQEVRQRYLDWLGRIEELMPADSTAY